MTPASPLSRLEKLAAASAEKEAELAARCCDDCVSKFHDIGRHQHIRGFIEGGKSMLAILSEPGEACGPRVWCFYENYKPTYSTDPDYSTWRWRISPKRRISYNEYCDLRELAQARAEQESIRVDLTECILAKEKALASSEARVRILTAELEAINTPEIHNFLKAVENEAKHQRLRWASDHDAGKTDADWFWLIGYLAGKAINKPEKMLHHIITTAAACLNWHAARVGTSTKMRPGIEPPDEANLEVQR